MFNTGDIVRKGDRSFTVAGQTSRGAVHGFGKAHNAAALVHVIARYGTKQARVLTFARDRLQPVTARRVA